jgi:large subunit ribosomal protein L35
MTALPHAAIRKENNHAQNQDTQRREEEIFTYKSGKVKRSRAFQEPYPNKKTTKRKRTLRQGAYADVTNESTVKKMIPYK